MAIMIIIGFLVAGFEWNNNVVISSFCVRILAMWVARSY